jgi:alpha-L-fucosidase
MKCPNYLSNCAGYKQGYLGTENFYAPEHEAHNRFGQSFTEVPGEVCTTMITRPSTSWGWTEESRGMHLTADEVMKKISDARAANCNLLLNSGPLADGSLDPEDTKTLLVVGERLSRH